MNDFGMAEGRLMNEEWQKIYSKRGKFMYEGFVRDGNASFTNIFKTRRS